MGQLDKLLDPNLLCFYISDYKDTCMPGALYRINKKYRNTEKVYSSP